MYLQNYHKHTSYSHRYNKDSSVTHMDYIKYYGELAKQGIPTIYSTMEHGWQSPYFRIYDDLEKFNKEMAEDNPNYVPIKFVFGTEGYWVKDRFAQDSSNCHIVLLAKNDNGRKKINRIIYESFKSGYYYKNRMDLDLLLQLPKDDVMVTTACVAFWNKYDDIDNIVLKLNEHFTSFYLEVQANNTPNQKELNKHILDLHYKYNIPLIAGLDSHVIKPEQMQDREYLLLSNHIKYEDEEGWYMDIPTVDELVRRFEEQGVLSIEEINEAIENTNVCLNFDDIVLDRSIKVPVAKRYQGWTQEQRNNELKRIVNEEWQKQYNDMNLGKLDEYYKEIQDNVNEVLACNMADYFLDDYWIMKRGIEDYGGILTPSGRGSGVSFFLNKLLGFTKVDKINADVIMYAERFLTATRILESHTPPDIDMNVSDRNPFIEAQIDELGEDSTFDLLACGTLKYKSAFKMFARANDVEPTLADEVSKQISVYEEALKHKNEDEEIDIYDYVDKEKYGYLIEGCQPYRGIIDNLKAHPCGTIAYNHGDVIEDVGVIMVKSESQGDKAKEIFVAVIESHDIDAFGILKNDFLVVDSIGLTYDIYKEIGMNPMSVNELMSAIKDDKPTWDVYSKGLTMCINQVEQTKSTEKVMRYKPKNIAELTQFVAAIRPAFQSMYKIFEERKHFDYGIKTFDSLIQDEFCDSSFILYQEHLMKVLGFAGFPMSETYTIIKAISKKKKAVIESAKEKFLPKFTKAILDTKETDDESKAWEYAEEVWTVIENSASYGFNCVSGDTILKRGSSNGHKPLTIEEMWLTLNDKEWAINNHHKDLYGKYKRNGYGTALSMGNDSNIHNNKVIDIIRQPKAQLYLITTESGKQIKATENHKFPTQDGVKCLRDLTIDDSLYIMGTYKQEKFNSALTDGNFENNLPTKGQQGFQNKPNGDSVIYDNFRDLKLKQGCVCEDCGKKANRYEVHHVDFDRTHNSFDNYAWLCVSCHKKRHYQNGRTKRYEKGIPTYFEKIVSIEKAEFDYVYDITMSEDVGHNFVANDGIVTCNSAHAYSMAIDSVTLAWLKAHYPLEFYKVCLQRYTNKGDKNKVIALKAEMNKLGIKLNPIKFGDDNRTFTINKENGNINQTIQSLKNVQKIAPQILYEMGQKSYPSLFHIFKDLKASELNKKSLDIIFKLDYFSEYGDVNYILQQWEVYNKVANIYEKIKTAKKLTKATYEPYFDISELAKYGKETAKQITVEDSEGLYKAVLMEYPRLTKEIEKSVSYTPITQLEKMVYQCAYNGACDIVDESQKDNMFIVSSVEENKYGTPFITMIQCNNGQTITFKGNKRIYSENKCDSGDVIMCYITKQPKRVKNENDEWIDTGDEEVVIKDYAIVRKFETP